MVRLLAVVVVCLALFAAVLWFAGGRNAGPVPAASATASPATAPVSAATPNATAVASARQKLAAAMHAASTAAPGSHQPVSLTLSEAEVNAIAVPELESEASFPLQQPSVQILPGKLILNGQAALGPTTLPVAVTGSVGLVDGVPTLTVTSVQASGLNAPDSIVRQVSDQLAANLRLTPADLPITVQQVLLGEHTLTVAGVTK
jgi:hypothetical protein